MVANGSAVMISRGHPIDFGKHFIDGRRVLGDGKTFEGLVVGVFYGASFALIISILLDNAQLFLYGVLSAIGAMLGDIGGSFIKRRMGLPRGASLNVVDQLDFALGASLLLYLAKAPLDYLVLVLMLLVIYFLHRLTNIIAYRVGLKSVPW